MTPEEIQQKIKSLAPWFHCIDLGGGLRTKTESAATEAVDHPAETWEKIKHCLPADLSGKSVLDVGCNAGFYVIEAKRRNAARVLGVDAQRHHVRQALFVRRVLELDIEYRRMSVYDLNRRSVGEFDVTLALGLIYHCKHLVLALERLFDVTRELMILETAILPLERTPESFVDFAAAGEATLHPLAFAGNSPEKKEHVFNWFLPGIEALKALLINVGFENVEVFDLKRDRAIVLCRKTHSPSEGLLLSQVHAEISLIQGRSRYDAGSKMIFPVFIKNTGSARWATRIEEGERGKVRLGAHLLLENGEELSWDYGRSTLPRDLESGDALEVSIELTAPGKPGRYIIEFDLVLEHLTWFEDLGTTTVRHSIDVT